MVTFTPSSRKTRSSGRGRKSGTTLRVPRGLSVYLILSLIDSLSFAPIAGSEDTDYVLKVSEANREDSDTNLPETVVPRCSLEPWDKSSAMTRFGSAKV